MEMYNITIQRSITPSEDPPTHIFLKCFWVKNDVSNIVCIYINV